MTDDKRRSDCPINLSLEIFGDKWTLLILRDIFFFENRHFNKFVNLENISTNILTDRLNRLVKHQILIKEKDPKNLSAFVYSLTPRGLELLPTVLEIFYWGANHTPENCAPNHFYKAVKKDKPTVIKRLREKLIQSHNIKITSTL